MKKHTKKKDGFMSYGQAKFWLTWAKTPQYHGGTNPYGQPQVIQAEHVAAKHEKRHIENWA